MKKIEYTFDQWVEKVFVKRMPSFLWVWDNMLSPKRSPLLIAYATQLFQEPEFLIEKYTDKQFRNGFQNLPTEWGLRDCIWDKRVTWRLRRMCIRTMVPLFEKFFSHKPLDDTCFMWWDFFRYFGDDPDEKVIAEMFRALKQILFMKSMHCQLAALHGLGHLEHPRKEALIKKYLDKNPGMEKGIRDYALACISGNIL